MWYGDDPQNNDAHRPKDNVLPRRVEIGDIRDAEAFVKRAIRKTRIRYIPAEEFEDVVACGLLILVRLYDMYDPARDGGADVRVCGDRRGVASFAGYANHLLPNKIRDAWHKMHPEHVLLTQEDGKRRYAYGDAPRSLDEMVETYHGGVGSNDDDETYSPFDLPGNRHVGDFVRRS